MSERILYGENQEPLVVSPVFLAHTTTTLGDIELDYANTRLRHFPGNDDMDHLEYTGPDGRVIGIFFTQLEETAPAELSMMGYPATVDPIPPEADIRWYDQAVMDRMNVKVEETDTPMQELVPAETGRPGDTTTLVLMGATAMVLAFAADKIFGSNNGK